MRGRYRAKKGESRNSTGGGWGSVTRESRRKELRRGPNGPVTFAAGCWGWVLEWLGNEACTRGSRGEIFAIFALEGGGKSPRAPRGFLGQRKKF